uniref:Metalloendopeptidase n=1 Tax=Romanomermis culicivorax TaxID=13658 RepID=A0A915HN43_ROMCU
MVQHELMHLLGFQHEEQRMDRDQYLEILAENICQEDSMKEFNITLPGYDVTSYPYDVESVMQDHDSKGACFRSKPTMRDRQGRQLGRQISLTAIDAQKINDVYQCGQILAPKPVPSGRPVNPCTFDVDWCGYTQYYKRSLYSTTDNDTFADDFDWVRTNQPVPGVGADYTVQQDHTGNGNEKIIKVIDYKTYKSEWTEALVDIPIETGTRFQVIFQANAGETHISDTAIDDIAIYSTSCSTEIDEKNLVQI